MKIVKMIVNTGLKSLFILVSGVLLNHSLFSQPTLEIWEIQGSGSVSPYDGQLVISPDNIVTAKKYDGFFMQTPEDRTDGNFQTSDGIFVETGGNTEVKVGDRVDVRGFIQDRGRLTRFDLGSSFSVLSSGSDLPPPVQLNGGFPGPSASDSSSLEQIEGMRVRFEGITSGPANFFGEFPATATNDRVFREPGIRYPGLPGLPVWDGNPEVFWVDPDGSGAPDNRLITSETIFAATGVMSFQFGKYTLFPEGYTLTSAPSGRQVRERREGEFTVGSLNAFLLLQSEPGYQRKLRKLAKYIVDFMGAPDILALQEIDNLRALNDLIEEIRSENNALSYTAHFEPGPGEFNTGYLTSSRVIVENVAQLGRFERTSTGELLHNRPPFLLEARLGFGGPSLQLINVHIRSRIGIEESDSTEVRLKRYEQSLSIARMVRERQDANLFVLGDFNAYQFTDGYADLVNQIAGQPGGAALYPFQDIVNPPLRNLTAGVDASERYSYVRNGNAQLLDHCLAGEMTGLRIEEVQFARGNADTPFLQEENEETALGSSDHDGFVVFLQTNESVATTPPVSLPGVTVQYPNPMKAGGTVFIENTSGEPVEVNLVSTSGQLLHHWKAGIAGKQGVPLPGDLPAGGYWLILQNGKRRGSFKLVLYD